ncbi:MAG TPA: alpha/beta fold hydrolase [Actinomycetota bacterium]
MPEDRSVPDGRRIELAVAVIPAAADDPAPDAVFFLAGGPGGAAIASWAQAAATFPGIHATRDIVLVDQRGTGDSSPLVGPALPVAGADAPARRQRALVRSWVRRALHGLDADLRRYTSTEAADDLDDVREALGYDRIDLYGGSYGATLAQYYLRQHSEHVRAAVLDGGTLLDVPIFELIALRSREALESVFARCRADRACHGSYPDPAGDLSAVLATLERSPATVEARTPTSTREVLVTAEGFAGAIHQLLVESRAGEIPDLLHHAAEGDLAAVAALVAESEATSRSLRQLMPWAIRCSEPWAVDDPERASMLGRGSYLQRSEVTDARQIRWVCGAMPPFDKRPSDGRPVRSDVPILLLNGTEDPQDPPANVADAPSELTNSLTVEVLGYGHTVGHVGCLPAVVADFLDAGTTVGLETRCASEMAPPPFVVP